MDRVLITGANSYIGTSFETWIKNHNSGIQVETLDMLGKSWESADFSKYDTVFHVAGIAHQKETKQNAHMYYDVNEKLAIAVAKKAKAEGVKQFVILSSMSVYGTNRGHITKQTVENPSTHYGKSKYLADQAIIKLQAENFVVSILRPPMVYGKGCKGNYQLLSKLSRKIPFFPNIRNERSMIYIWNLTAFVEYIIKEKKNGIFFPQNAEYVNTGNMVSKIAEYNGKKMHLVPIFNWMIKILLWMRVGIAEKVFASLTYEKVDLCETIDFQNSIMETENKE